MHPGSVPPTGKDTSSTGTGQGPGQGHGGGGPSTQTLRASSRPAVLADKRSPQAAAADTCAPTPVSQPPPQPSLPHMFP